MARVNISEKGKALLRNRTLSRLVSKAMTTESARLANGESVTVTAPDGQSVTFKRAMAFATPANKRR
jgi:hypothetical protein